MLVWDDVDKVPHAMVRNRIIVLVVLLRDDRDTGQPLSGLASYQGCLQYMQTSPVTLLAQQVGTQNNSCTIPRGTHPADPTTGQDRL